MSFEVETIGTDPAELSAKMAEGFGVTKGEVNDALMEAAEEIKDAEQETAPVDTGDYKNSWYIEPIAEDEVLVLSDGDEAPHNKYVMLPNQRFVGNPKADIPSQGVLHNYKGVAKRKKNALTDSIQSVLNANIGDV
jgi:hypothetical protein